MTTVTKRMVVLPFITAPQAIVGTGCNMAQGFGREMEKTGGKIPDETK